MVVANVQNKQLWKTHMVLTILKVMKRDDEVCT